MFNNLLGRVRRLRSKSSDRDRKRAAVGYALRFEALEERRLLAVVTLSNGSDAELDASSTTRAVTFTTSNFASGSSVTDVNAQVQFTKTDGTCSSPPPRGMRITAKLCISCPLPMERLLP